MKSADAAKIAEKRYGQNFLQDARYLRQIIEAMPEDGLPVVEIGPGLGDLTTELIRAGNDVTAYEVDERLCDHLRRRFAREIDEGRLRLLCGDVLEHWERNGSLHEAPYRLVANLPYYIATNLVLRALRDDRCQSVLTMVQKEVAEKFAAEPGEKAFSSLAVLARSCGESTLLFDVPPEAFVPAPKVTSAVVEIRKERSLDDTGFERFLKDAFAQPRKTLRKNLSTRFDSARLDTLFSELGLERALRPHQVDASVYHRLYNALEKESNDGEQQEKRNVGPVPRRGRKGRLGE